MLGSIMDGNIRNNDLASMRESMVVEQLIARGVKDERVLAAMRKVPRHEFVPEAARDRAYSDGPVPIGHDQTISQPYIVAIMCELAALSADARVLEIGTGCGYQTAVLAELAAEVYSVEIVEPLAEKAEKIIARLGYDNVHMRVADGYQGWPEAAPFDAVLVAAAPHSIPSPLVEQLALGGKLVIPVGDFFQHLYVLERTPTRVEHRDIFPVRFVPMTGKAQLP